MTTELEKMKKIFDLSGQSMKKRIDEMRVLNPDKQYFIIGSVASRQNQAPEFHIRIDSCPANIEIPVATDEILVY